MKCSYVHCTSEGVCSLEVGYNKIGKYCVGHMMTVIASLDSAGFTLNVEAELLPAKREAK